MSVVASGDPLNVSLAPSWLDSSVRRSQVALALGITLLISRLPEITLREVLQVDVPLMSWAGVALTVGLWLASRVAPALRPLERYLSVMIVVGLAVASLEAAFNSAAWIAFTADAQPMLALLASRILMAVTALIVLITALALGATQREAYLAVGDLNAPTRSRTSTGVPLRWRTFGPLAFVGLMLLTVWFTVPLLPERIDVTGALPFIGIGAVAALLNAFWEEAAFRAAPLSFLQRVVGPGAGVLILAVWFGLGHFYGGTPSGPMGLIAAGTVAVLFGRAMIETRGLGWPLVLHFAGDLVIFTFLAIRSVA
jgi:membrane protease YdiL (CAAX protease family)